MPAASGTQQGRAALVVHRINGQIEIEQSLHGFGRTGHRRRRQVRRLQASSRQRPAAPFEPMTEIAPSGRQGHAQGGLTVRRTRIGLRTMPDQGAQRAFAAQRCGDVHGRVTARVALVRIDARGEGRFEQALPTEADRQDDRRILTRRRGENVGAAFEQHQRELLVTAVDVLAAETGAQVARQAAGATDGLAVLEQAHEGGQGVSAAIEQMEEGAVVAVVQGVGRGAMASQPVEHGQIVFAGELDQHLRHGVLAGTDAEAQHRHRRFPTPRRQRFAQQLARCLFEMAGGEAFGDIARQGIVRIEHRHQGPAAVRDGFVDRAHAARIRLRGIHAERHQLPQEIRRGAGTAGQQQGIGAVGIDRTRIGFALRQARQRFGLSVARGFEQGRAALGILRIAIGAGIEQGADDLGIAGGAGLHQGGALPVSARIDARLVPQQQLHADRIVFARSGGEQGGLAIGRLGFRAVFDQEPREAPVRRLAGQAQRAVTLVVERIDLRTGVQQQGRDGRIGAARGVVQGRIAFAIGRAWVGAVRQQGHHGFRPPMPAVAGGREQRRQAAMFQVQVDAARDQLAQQPQIAMQDRQHRQRALVAIARVGLRIRVRAFAQGAQRRFDLAGPQGGEQPVFGRYAGQGLGQHVRGRLRLRRRRHRGRRCTDRRRHGMQCRMHEQAQHREAQRQR